MSTTKIIKGCAIDNGQSVFFAQSDKRPTAPWQPAALYIGTGKLWTEDEVQTALSSKDAEIEALREAAKDVVSRWDSPKWKYDEHTGVIINRLRVAAKLDQP